VEWIVAPLLSALVAVLFDWAGAGKVALLLSGFDYRYWPPSKPRAASVLVLWISTIPGAVFALRRGEAPMWPVLCFGVGLIVWAVVSFVDLIEQQRSGYRRPGRYSDPNR
jgi:hypothetical protein